MASDLRATGREVTIWRAGTQGPWVPPLSWGYQRTWIHPTHGTITAIAAATAAAFAAGWRNAGGTVAETTLVDLHQRRRMSPAVLRPALTAVGVPARLVSQLCTQLPVPLGGATQPLAS